MFERYGHNAHTFVCDGGGEYVNNDTMHYWKIVKKYDVKGISTGSILAGLGPCMANLDLIINVVPICSGQCI